jgi:hypothetical protein
VIDLTGVYWYGKLSMWPMDLEAREDNADDLILPYLVGMYDTYGTNSLSLPKAFE